MPKAEVVAAPTENTRLRPRVVKILKFSKSGSQRAQVKKLTVLGNQRVTAGGIVKRSKTRPVSTKKRSQST
jgi:hypothetical protein